LSAVSLAGADWRRAVEPYVGPDARRASLQLVTTLVLLGLAMGGSWLALQWSVIGALALAPVIAGLLVRVFIFMHDCAHASFYADRRVNDAVGFITGVITFTPFAQWRRDHALHHASSGDLARRGHGDIPTLTVREYLSRSWTGRLLYRIVRHPVLLLLGGPFHLVIGQRIRGKSTATKDRQLASVWGTNVALIATIAIGILSLGWTFMLVAYFLPYYIAATTGVWLFYVQHQFEDAYWAEHDEWNYVDAALLGSSHLKLPRVLAWFTGSIGLHHVHHVAPRIPNYRLQECHDGNPLFQRSPTVTFRSGMRALRLGLWDEERRRLVSFRDIDSSLWRQNA
jgi:omega-6 fatty acid desaturase (delta-12 desaturase)